jgi:hypothetical protein
MDDSDFQCFSSDSEMLDDMLEEAYPPAFASPVHVDHVVDEDVALQQPHHAEPAAFIADHDMCSQADCRAEIGGNEDGAGSPHVRACPPDMSKHDVGSNSFVLAKIENIFEGMLDVLLNERGQLSIAIKTRSTSHQQQLNNSGNASQPSTEAVQLLCFPGKTEKEAWRFGECDMYSERFCRSGTNVAQLS